MDVARHGSVESTFESLQAVVERLRSASSRDEIVAIVRSSARRIIGADGVAIVLLDGDQCHYVEEDAIGPLWKGERFPAESCVSGWAMSHRQTVVIPDILFDPRVPQEAYRQTFVRSMAMAPMGKGNPHGALGAYWAHTYAPSPTEIEALEQIAQAAGSALVSLRSREVERPDQLPPRSAFPARKRRHLGFPDLFLRVLPKRILPFWQGQLLAIGAVAVSAVLRGGLTPIIGTTSIFTSFFPAILVATLVGGASAAVTAVGLSTVAGAAIDLAIGGTDNVGGRMFGWLFFAVIGALAAVVASIARIALDQQRVRGDALEQRDWQLAHLSRELDHRTRNTLAVVMALTGQAARSSSSAEEMSAKLLGQFEAMAVAQQSLFDPRSRAPSLALLLTSCLAPFMEQGRLELAVDPDVDVPEGSEMMLCLAFNELATNACKYGALSIPDGQVRVTSEQLADRIVIQWSESGGPKVNAVPSRSVGTRLIENALVSADHGKVEIDYLPAGLICRFSWRARNLAELDRDSIDQRQASR